MKKSAAGHSPPSHIFEFGTNFFFYNASIAVMTPFLQLFLKAKGFSITWVGSLIGSYELAGIVGTLFLGNFLDRSGRYRAVMTASIGGVLLFFFILYLNTSSVAALFCIVPIGFLYKPHFSLIDALASRNMPRFEENYGKARLAGSIGFVCAAGGIQLTGWVTDTSLLSIVLGFGFFAVLYMFSIQIIPQSRTRSGKALFTFDHKSFASFTPTFWLGLFVIFLMGFGISSHYYFFSLFVKSRFQVPNVGGFWAIGPLAEIPFIFFSGLLIKRFGIARLWIVSLVTATARLYLYVFSSSILPLYFLQLLHGITYGLMHTTSIAFIRRHSRDDNRGLAMAVYIAIGIGFAGFIGGFLGGRIVDTGGFTSLYLTYGTFPLLAALLVAGKRNALDSPGIGPTRE
jgi:PPP family 3-phenylpropionic acid transporter